MKNKQAIILIGGGGHCRSVIDVIDSTGRYSIVGVIDNDPSLKQVLNVPVIGTDNDIENILEQHPSAVFHLTLGHVATGALREKIAALYGNLGLSFETIRSPHSHVSEYSDYGTGNSFMHYSLINAGAKIGNNNIFNSRALVEHDCVIGDFNHISTNATLNGGITVGNRVFIGSGSVIREGVSIADNTVIGAGSVVIKSIIEEGVYYGNPATRR